MADETPVAAPAEAVEQPERTAAAAGDKPADQQSENVTATEEKKIGKLQQASAHHLRLEVKLPQLKLALQTERILLSVRPQHANLTCLCLPRHYKRNRREEDS